MESPIDREGERRQITVFFSDLSGYTALTEQLDPEDVRTVMDRVFGHATAITERYGGRIDRFLGDAVMGVFGDQVAHEDDAERAVRTVLDLHAAVDELSDELEPGLGRPIAMHSGIGTGLVVTDASLDRAVGEAINLASRLEGLSRPGQILVGPETQSVVAGVFNTQDHGTHALKGISEPVAVTRILGVAARRSEPSRRQGTFVGRDTELGLLLQAADRLRLGESAVITIEADAGTGKTRLFAEFQERLHEDVRWLEGRAYSYGENIPYAAVIDLLSHAIAMTEEDDAASIEAKLRDAVIELPGDTDRLLAPLSRLFGFETHTSVPLDREGYRERLLDSITALLDDLARRQPTVVAFQDLHWSDPSTVELIRNVITRIDAPVLIVANFRPGFALDAAGERALTLTELAPADADALLRSLLDDQRVPDQLSKLMIERTDGNPFFIEELVNSFVETGVLIYTGERWEVGGDLVTLELPTSIRGVIGARIDRFDDLRRQVLREASVVGRDFLYDVVKQVSTVTEELDPSLHDLEDADLIREKARDPDLEYFFKHALTQEVAYDGLLRAERERLHARTGAAIEAQFAGRIEELTESLAYHYARSGLLDKAVFYLRAAGRKAIERFALTESEAHYRRAYELLERQPESADNDIAMVDLVLDWALLAYYQARLRDLLVLLEEHRHTVERIDDTERLALWTAWIGHCEYMVYGEAQQAEKTLSRAVELGERAGSSRAVAYAQAWRVWCLFWLGRFEEALEAGAVVMERSGELPEEPYPLFKSRGGVGLVLANRGDFEQARAIADDLIAFGERTGNARAASVGHTVLTFVAQLTLDFEGARTAYQAAAAANDPIYEHNAAGPMLFSLLSEESFTEARSFHDDQVERFVDGRHVWVGHRIFELADAVLRVSEGRWADGFTQAEEVTAAASEADELWLAQIGELVQARLYLAVETADRPGVGDIVRNLRFAVSRAPRAGKEARDRFERLDAEIDGWGLGGWRFSIELDLAKLLAHQGDSGAAASHLQAAIEAAHPAVETEALRHARSRLEDLTQGTALS